MKILKGHHAILDELHEELNTAAHFEPIWPDEDDTNTSLPPWQPPVATHALKMVAYNLEQEPILPSIQTLRSHSLPLNLLPALLKQLAYEGTDIPVEVNMLYRPGAFPLAALNPHRWEWHTSQQGKFEEQTHLTLHELTALLRGVSWRVDYRTGPAARFLHLSDAPKVLGPITAGRSVSRRINQKLRELGAVQMAAGIYMVTGWIGTHANPACVVLTHHGP